jgi:molybdopterin molybdotransferase
VLAPKTAIGIATGAPLPLGADAVIPWEDVSAHERSIELRRPVAAGAHVFPPGDDARRGDVIARAGEPLTPGRAAILAAAGISRVPVYRRPRVGIVCTGDELVDVEMRPQPVRSATVMRPCSHSKLPPTAP